MTDRTSQPRPRRVRVERDIHGDGGGTYDAYLMPAVSEDDFWAAITSYEGQPRACPVRDTPCILGAHDVDAREAARKRLGAR